MGARKVDVRQPGKRNSNSHGARSVHLIVMMMKWIRTSRLSMKKSLSGVRFLVSEVPRNTTKPQHSLIPLSSEYGIYKAVKARFWPWLSGKNAQNFSGKSPQNLSDKNHQNKLSPLGSEADLGV